MKPCRRLIPVALLFLFLPSAARTQENTGKRSIDALRWADGLDNQYLVFPDQAYGYFTGSSVKLDVWEVKTKEAVPTVIYYHGGGWLFGDRTGAMLFLMPWFVRGWNVVNVEYRMSGTALAPAAVEDTRCALRWVYRNAKQFHLDTSRIVVTGHSAGGHLALMAGMLTESDGLDKNCPSEPSLGESPLKVAAVVDWYGPTDIPDLLQGPNRKTYAISWIGSQQNGDKVASLVSPLQHVHAGLPPILMLQGDQDPVVPYEQSVRLHHALDKAHIPNELYAIPGGKHGQFGVQAETTAYDHVWEFLEKNIPSLPARMVVPASRQ